MNPQPSQYKSVALPLRHARMWFAPTPADVRKPCGLALSREYQSSAFVPSFQAINPARGGFVSEVFWQLECARQTGCVTLATRQRQSGDDGDGTGFEPDLTAAVERSKPCPCSLPSIIPYGGGATPRDVTRTGRSTPPIIQTAKGARRSGWVREGQSVVTRRSGDALRVSAPDIAAGTARLRLFVPRARRGGRSTARRIPA